MQLPHYDVCSGCGGTNVIGVAFDAQDYDLLSAVLDAEKQSPVFLHWTAPKGPGAGHMGNWAGVAFSSLTDKMPHLRQETYDSFIKRNETMAVHFRAQFQTRGGQVVRIAGEGSRDVQPLYYYTRAGFSEDGTQALIYCGTYTLWEKRGDEWILVESKTERVMFNLM
jgi:hypothetical protein